MSDVQPHTEPAEHVLQRIGESDRFACSCGRLTWWAADGDANDPAMQYVYDRHIRIPAVRSDLS